MDEPCPNRRRAKPARNRARGRATGVLLGVAFLFPGAAAALAEGERLTVPPAGRASWQEMAGAERVRAPARGARTFAGMGITTSFAALGDDNTRFPPDTNGAVGPAHVVTMLNTQVRVQQRDGTTLDTVSLVAFWTSGTGLSGTPFDPRLQYDPAIGRWIATVVAGARDASSAVWFAISDGTDPMGDWTFYAFDADASDVTWADFPGFGSNADYIAITNNMFLIDDPPPGRFAFEGAKMWVISTASAVTGGALDVTVFATGFNHLPAGCIPFGAGCTFWSFSMQPAIAPGKSGTMYLVDSTGFSVAGIHVLRLSQISGPAQGPAWTFVPDAAGPAPGTGAFMVPEDFETSLLPAAQPGSASGLDSGDVRVSANAVHRNDRVWATHVGGLPLNAVDRTAVFWYEIDPSLLNSTGAPVVQSGIIDGGQGVHLIYPSVAVNAVGDARLGFSRSSAAVFAEGVTAGRSSLDPPGFMGPLEVVKAGEDTYLKQGNGDRIRWGDYSATVVDPSDDLSFWTIQQYAESDVGPGPGDDRWGTWWALVPFDPGTTTSTSTTTSTTVSTTTTSTSTTTSSTSTTLEPAACGDPVGESVSSAAALVTATDALFILRAAVGSETCALCVCDVDDSGAVAASDALVVLQVAVGGDLPLDCPPCAAASTGALSVSPSPGS